MIIYKCVMAANVLNSQRAVRMSVYVIRAFVRLREVFVTNQILGKRLVEIEKVLLNHDGALRDLYKKHHWQVAGPTFYQLHLLFDKHYEEQNVLVDAIAERIQLLGGVSIAMAHDVAEITLIPRPPKGREEAPVQISRLLHGHEIVLKEARTMARLATEGGDDGTNDLIVSDIIRKNELQVWFVAEHVVDSPLTHAGA